MAGTDGSGVVTCEMALLAMSTAPAASQENLIVCSTHLCSRMHQNAHDISIQH